MNALGGWIPLLLSVAGSFLGVVGTALWKRNASQMAQHPYSEEALRSLEGRVNDSRAQLNPEQQFRLLQDFLKARAAIKVLLAFAVVVVSFGAITIVRYWSYLAAHGDDAFFASWLFITMVAGMFVQVLSSNYREGRDLLDVSATQLLFPLLFAIVVFYPIWAIGAAAAKTFFAVYAILSKHRRSPVPRDKAMLEPFPRTMIRFPLQPGRKPPVAGRDSG
jgi:hypothetical protein